MNQIIELLIYVAAGGAMVWAGHAWSDPTLTTMGVGVLGAALGFGRGSYVPPLTGGPQPAPQTPTK